MSEALMVEAAADFLRERIGAERVADLGLGLVLGSGLRSFADGLTDPVRIAFADVPHWPAPKVEGHGADLVVGRVADVPVVCLSGRVHLYEGWSPVEVVRAVRTLRRLGVDEFLLTNAAGGIGDALSPGDLMAIGDHLNLTGSSPLIGSAEPELGPRFPDQSRVYSPELLEMLKLVDSGLAAGVYAGLLGPSYETPAEVKMLKQLGADAVGMSTVHEAMALNAMGAEVAAVSLISNLAAGIADTALSHDEVIEAGRRAEGRLVALLTGFSAMVQARS